MNVQGLVGHEATHELGEAIAGLAARLHAATSQLLVMLREFDAREGRNNGFLSCAHWLHSTPTRRPRASGAPAWRTGIDLGARREKVRVAKALAALPLTSAIMERGQFSYAKVRAIPRVATTNDERRLVDVALSGTASHVERVVRAWRRVDRMEEAQQANSPYLRRHVSIWQDDDGMVIIRGRLAGGGAVVQRALDAASDVLFLEHGVAAQGQDLAEDVTPARRRADALGRLAEVAQTADLDSGAAGDRYQVVVHVDAAGTGTPMLDGGVLEMDAGPIRVSAETSKRVARGARRGGHTSLDNPTLLCRRHHRAVHEGRLPGGAAENRHLGVFRPGRRGR